MPTSLLLTHRRRVAGVLLWTTLAASAALGCAGGGGANGSVGLDVASEAQWRVLREVRPEALPGAARVTVSEVSFLGDVPWPDGAAVGAELGISELITTNLLPRRDVDFVERRRFAAAAAAERRGEPGPPGRPPAGVSRSADLGIGATWIPTGADAAAVEIRLVDMETGDVVGTGRLALSRPADGVGLARTIVRGTLRVLDELDRLPAWDDPRATPGGDANVPVTSGVSMEAMRHFLRGLAAEEAWSWERARRGYQDALAVEPDFYEARAALARTARLRLGGTLAES